MTGTEAYIPSAPLLEDLERWTSETPDLVAVTYEDRRWTWSQLGDAVRKAALTLANLGVRPGVRVCVQLDNSPESIALVFAVWRCGGTVVPVSLMLSQSEMRHVLQDAQARIGIFPSSDGVPNTQLSSAQLLTYGEVLDDQPVTGRGRQSFTQPEAADEALILYTSGTTGKPKGAIHTVSSVRATVVSQARRLKGRPGPYSPPAERKPPNVIPFPLAHSSGLLSVLFAFVVGRAVITMTKFDPVRYADLVERYKVDSMFGTPTMYQMLATSRDVPAEKLGSVRIAISGAAPLSQRTRERFEEKFEIPLLQTYGQTESGHIAGWASADLPMRSVKRDSVGRPYRGVEVYIQDERGNNLPAGQVGEIACRSNGSMVQYAGIPRAGGNVLLTGDLGYLDEDGFLYVVGRRREVIIAGGFNVYPAEVEATLRDHPAVKDVAVFGIPDNRLGEVPVALIVPEQPEADEVQLKKDLTEFGREHLSKYKAPRDIVFVAGLPQTETLKTRISDLAQLYETSRDGHSTTRPQKVESGEAE